MQLILAAIVLILSEFTAANTYLDQCCPQKKVKLFGLTIPSQIACSLYGLVCDQDDSIPACLHDSLTYLQEEIIKINETLYWDVAETVPNARYPELYKDLNAILRDQGFDSAMGLVEYAMSATNQDYNVRFLNLYCKLSPTFFNDIKETAMKRVQKHNRKEPKNKVNGGELQNKFDASVQALQALREATYKKAIICYECTIYKPLSELFKMTNWLCPTLNFGGFAVNQFLTNSFCSITSG